MNQADRKRPGRSLLCGVAAVCTLLVTGNFARGDASNAPIDVGSRKQLFIDDKFIESIRGVERVMNRPWQTGEVLITVDQPWELQPQEGHISAYSSVIKEDGRVRIWYDFVQPTGPGPYDHQRRVLYAESEDGLHFVKPELGLHEINGSKANNVVLPGVIGGCAVWIDPNAPPEHRYKTQTKVYPSGEFHMHSSPDGLKWKLFANIDPRGKRDTQAIVFWDKYIQRYVFYGRREYGTSEIKVRCRRVRRAEMTDLRSIINKGLALWPDELDLTTYDVDKTEKEWAPMDFYGATVFPYEEADRVYIMLAQAYWHWQRGPNNTTCGFLRSTMTRRMTGVGLLSWGLHPPSFRMWSPIRQTTPVSSTGSLALNIAQYRTCAQSLRDRFRALFNGRPVRRIIRNATSFASFTAATDVLIVLRTRSLNGIRRCWKHERRVYV